MERVSEYAVITHTGWPYVPTEKVAALLQKTGWFAYKLAIGVQTGMFQSPLQLQWTTKQLKVGEYDPSVAELFDGISLQHGESYFLMVSNLHKGLKNTSRRDEYRTYFDEALWRYRDLYMPRSAMTPTAPSLIQYIHQESDKRPAETPPEGEPAAGSRAKLNNTDSKQSLAANLAALRLCAINT